MNFLLIAMSDTGTAPPGLSPGKFCELAEPGSVEQVCVTRVAVAPDGSYLCFLQCPAV